MTRYVGRITNNRTRYGWIELSTITKEDGSPHELKTKNDVYLHRDNYDGKLVEGAEVKFIVTPDETRGEGTFRALFAHETERSILERTVKGGIELTVQGLGNSRVIEQSSIFASWCLTAEVAAKVKERRSDDKAVKLLLVHWPMGRRSDRTERRQLVDLSDPMAIIGFNAAGANRVFALIVSARSESALRDTYLTRKDGRFITHVISADDVGTVLGSKDDCLGSGCIEVDIPENLFAGQPFDWRWVNFFFKTDPRDQCAFRRRRMFAYTLQPIVVLVIGIVLGVLGTFKWTVSFICIAAMLSVGTRHINYAPLRHPLRDTPDETWDDAEGSAFIPVVRGRHFPLPLAVSPLVLIVAALGTTILAGVQFKTLAWWIDFGELMLVPTAIFCLITWYVVWWEGVDWEQVKQQRLEDERRRFALEIDELICATTGPRKPDVWQLPLGPKTFRFYALALKQKVCKGFAAA